MRIGEVIDGKYQLVRQLGEGGMGAVFEAHHTLIGRKHAVKLLHPELAKNRDMVTRFLHEAKAATAIGSPHIVDVTDAGQAYDGSPYLVMELLEGRSLSELIEAEGPLAPERAASLLIQVCEALELAHQRDIVHRDLKPENLFVIRWTDGSEWVKVLDFGIAKVRSTITGQSSVQLTRTGATLGTPFYMAPEQFMGSKDVDRRADVYAAGVILYEMLGGARPFDAQSYEELIIKVATAPPAPLRSRAPHLDPQLEQVVHRAMARETEQRFDSMAELAAALRPYADGAAPSASTSRPSTPQTVAVSPQTVAPLPQTAASLPQTAAALSPTLALAEPSRHSNSTVIVLVSIAALLAIGLTVLITTAVIGGDSDPPAPVVVQEIQQPETLAAPLEPQVAGAIDSSPDPQPTPGTLAADPLAPIFPSDEPAAVEAASTTPPAGRRGGTSKRGVTGHPASKGGGAASLDDLLEGAIGSSSGNGYYSVNTRPWTKVYIDGRYIRNTPLMRHQVKAGRHRITLINEDFDIRESYEVNIPSGENVRHVKNLSNGSSSRSADRDDDSSLPQRLTATQVREGMESVGGAVRRCGNGQSGTVRVSVVISGATGRISSANVSGEFAGTSVGSCAARAVRGARFPRFQQSSLTVRYPYHL